MELGLNGKTVLVTGSAKGIGLKTAETFLREGAKVWVNGRSDESVNKALASLRKAVPGAQVEGVAADLGTEQGIRQMTQALPAVDVLINNAAIFKAEDFSSISRESWLAMFTVNVLAGAQLTQFYLPKMIAKNWGRVVFISSESALNVPAEMVHYGMSKTAQLAVSRGAAETCRGTYVTVNSVLPGPTLTDGIDTFIKQLGMTEKQFFKDARPSSIAQRFASTQEVAEFVAFVASERGSMINGAALRVDGGTVKIVF